MKKRTLSLTLALMLSLSVLSAYASPAVAAHSDTDGTIGAGESFSVVIKTDGSLWEWGRKALEGYTIEQRPVPARTGSDNDWAFVAASNYHSIGIKADGSLWTWGIIFIGPDRLTTKNIGVPLRVGKDNDWVSASTGVFLSFAIKSDGSLWGWGRNDLGVIGDGTRMDQLDPVQIGTDKNWISVSTCGYRTVALKADGSLWTWGTSRALGNGTFAWINTPIQIGADNHWASASAGYDYTVAIKTDGSLWAWGDSSFMERSVMVPRQLGGDTDWVSATAGWQHALAIKADGSLWSWGRNSWGQLGDGTTSKVYPAFPAQVGTDKDWVSASAGSSHSIALKKDGSLWAWGQNDRGQIGDDTTNDRLTPVKVADGVRVPGGTVASPSPSPSPPPTEQPTGWAREEVAQAVSLGIVPQNLQAGYTQATTRAEFCALAVALYEKVTGSAITERITFNDTNDINVQKMGALGVVTGVGNGNFAPNQSLTRQEAATMLARLAKAIGKPFDREAAAFDDAASIAPWAIVEVGQVQAAGIMGGTGSNRFSPTGSYTREQSIATMLRMYDCFGAD